MLLELTSAERRALRARAHALDPVVYIGDAGLSTPVLNEIAISLKSHDLIKIRVLAADHATRAAWLRDICTSLGAAPVQHIGKILVVFRPLPEEPAAATRKAKPSRKQPRRTKRSYQHA